MTVETLEKIVGILTILGGGVFTFIQWVYPRFFKKENSKPDLCKHDPKKFDHIIEKVLADVSNILFIMDQIVKKTDAVKVVLLKAHNGGGTPKIGNELNSTVLYEVSNDDEYPVFRAWRQQKLDKNYIRMLMNLIIDKTLNIVTEELPNSALKDIYLSHGIVFSKVIEIYRTPERYFYMSVVFKKGVEDLDPEERDYIRQAVSDIQAIYRYNKNLV